MAKKPVKFGVQVPADVTSLTPPTFVGAQGVSFIAATSPQVIEFEMVPDIASFPATPPLPTCVGTAVDGNKIAYQTQVVLTDPAKVSSTSVPVTVTITYGSDVTLTSLTITITLTY